MVSNIQVGQKLQTLLAKGDEVDRCYAIRSLACIQDGSAVEMLVNSLRDDDIDVCVDAAEALAQGEFASDVMVTEKLIESLLKDPDGEVKVACVRALVQREDPQAIPHLLSLVEKPPEDTAYVTDEWDVWWDMQLESIRGLGKMQVADAVPVLRRVLDTDDFLDIENEIFNALAAIGGVANAYLFTKLTEGNSRYRRRIAKALGYGNSAESLRPLARALKDPDADVREATLSSLLQRDAVQYLPAIVILFRDNSPTVRQLAIKVADQLSQQTNQKSIQHEVLIEKLLPLLRDSDTLVITTALNALSNLAWQPSQEDEEYLVSLLKTCIGDAFASVCNATLRLKLTDAVATLLYMLRHNELQIEEKMHALVTLGRFGIWNKAVESVIWASIFDDNKTVRVAAIEALAELDKACVKPATKPEGDKQPQRLPIDMITEAVQGSLEPPLTKKIIPITVVKEADKTKKEASQQVDPQEGKSSDEFIDDAKKLISASISEGEKPVPLSTLDSIVISRVEKQMECQQESENPAIEVIVEPDPEMDEFIALSEENAEISKWLLNKEVVDIDVDIQRLAARFLAQSNAEQAIPILLSVLNSDDSQLQREAILSLGAVIVATESESDTLTEQIASLHTALIKALKAEDRDLRIAAATVLGDLGTDVDIPALVDMLDDKEVAMRMQLLRSLVAISMRADDEMDYLALAEQILKQLDNNNETGIHRAAVDGLVALFASKLNGHTVALKQTAIDRLINAGLSGTDGQVKEMSWGLDALDKELSTVCLIKKMDQLSMSVERRYVIEMLGELHRSTA
ncbi:MAG: HEAT repeat domain-containing protein [Cocleimonas sp.]|nr:HEAT repeat domain-containing protein [Cocleimonas sp.]